MLGDVGIWINKDVENQTKSLCSFIRTDVYTETEINLTQPEVPGGWSAR